MRKSKRIKNLEIRLDAMSLMTETLIALVSDMMDKKNDKGDLDSGKWYKDRS